MHSPITRSTSAVPKRRAPESGPPRGIATPTTAPSPTIHANKDSGRGVAATAGLNRRPVLRANGADDGVYVLDPGQGAGVGHDVDRSDMPGAGDHQ
jgi:hypothetical protein